MEFKLPHNTTLTTTNHHKEFQHAVKYLLNTFTPKHKILLDVNFLKRDGVNQSANGDYTSAQFNEHFSAIIRVSYGKDYKGMAPWTFSALFHEYKHLLQDDEGYLYGEATKHINHCIEAQAWADEQVPIYLKTLDHMKSD